MPNVTTTAVGNTTQLTPNAATHHATDDELSNIRQPHFPAGVTVVSIIIEKLMSARSSCNVLYTATSTQNR